MIKFVCLFRVKIIINFNQEIINSSYLRTYYYLLEKNS